MLFSHNFFHLWLVFLFSSFNSAPFLGLICLYYTRSFCMLFIKLFFNFITSFSISSYSQSTSQSCRSFTTFHDKECTFCLYGLPLKNDKSYTNLGHIISSTLSDKENILYKPICSICHINSVLFFFLT
jgi:hypothetical protein